MAGYSKGIVDTRKLNKDSKAKLGRGGDTEVRKVDGKKSHVNALEAYLIDVNGKAGEEYAKRVGAGTVNPLTGMPEYHSLTQTHSHIDIDGQPASSPHGQDVVGYKIGDSFYDNEGNLLGGMELQTPQGGWTLEHGNPYEENTTNTTNNTNTTQNTDYSYEGLKNVTGTQLTAFDPELGGEDVKYFQDIFSDTPFNLLEQGKNLAMRGLQDTYEATMGKLGSQEATLGLQREDLTAQQTALGRTARGGFTDIGKGRATAASRSGLATSGTITQAYETQKKDLLQDYTAGIGDIKRQRADIDISMGDIGQQKATAYETLGLGQSLAWLDLQKGEYTEEQRQLDEYWDMIAMRQSV